MADETEPLKAKEGAEGGEGKDGDSKEDEEKESCGDCCGMCIKDCLCVSLPKFINLHSGNLWMFFVCF